MIVSLKHVIVPALRAAGFSGSFPHLRRKGDHQIDLFTFQFDRNGGGFVIEIAQCSPDGFVTSWGKQIPPNRVSAWDLHPDQRMRLRPSAGSGSDSWFRFDSFNTESVARSVLPFLEQAEVWYAAEARTGRPAAG